MSLLSIGLYPNYTNQVAVVLSNKTTDTIHLEIKTEELPELFFKKPIANGAKEADKLIFTTILISIMEKGKDMIFIPKTVGIDSKGEIRWYGDFKSRSHMVIEVVDGYLYAGSTKGSFAGKLVKYNFLGEELANYDFSKGGTYHSIHHDIRKTPNGSFLLTVNKVNAPTVENYILEYNPTLLGNNVQLELDLEDVLPNADDLFIDLPFSYYANKQDVLHINGIYPYPDGQGILVSSRNAGLAKVDALSGSLNWYLFPHVIKAKEGKIVKEESSMKRYLEKQYNDYLKDPNTYKRAPASGIFPQQDYTGFIFDYKEFLLEPLDKQGNPITDKEVVIYGKQSLDFSYPYRQHAPIILKNGNIAMFDNGDLNRNKNSFSRAVEYKVVEDIDGFGGTIQQVWEYTLSNN